MTTKTAKTICCPYCNWKLRASQREAPAIFEVHNQQEHHLDESRCAECPRSPMGVIAHMGGRGPASRTAKLPMPLCRRHMKLFAERDHTEYLGHQPWYVQIHTLDEGNEEAAWLRNIFGPNMARVLLTEAGAPVRDPWAD